MGFFANMRAKSISNDDCFHILPQNEIFIEMLVNVKKWLGFNLLEIDGSSVKIPRTTEVEKQFGIWCANSQNPCPLARISQMFDVLNKITIDAIIAPKATCLMARIKKPEVENIRFWI
jgi:hypothetical protein